MAIRPRIRKRVKAVRRAADGSAFQKWYLLFLRFWIRRFSFLQCSSGFVILCFWALFVVKNVVVWSQLLCLICTSAVKKEEKWRDLSTFRVVKLVISRNQLGALKMNPDHHSSSSCTVTLDSYSVTQYHFAKYLFSSFLGFLDESEK